SVSLLSKNTNNSLYIFINLSSLLFNFFSIPKDFLYFLQLKSNVLWQEIDISYKSTSCPL
ncbi:hypothetical protein, partial [Clostridium perfringens]|uniref:hypothetical protein n=1 Tax=Clostridium perfringens TaxID=1502 RepID=UPI00321AC764